MIDKTHYLPIAAQTRLLGVSRGFVYYRPVPLSERDRQLMRRIDKLHLAHPGSRPVACAFEPLNGAQEVDGGSDELRAIRI